MPQGVGYPQLPVTPTGPQPQGLGGGVAEQQQQQIMQRLAAAASDPARRAQIAQFLAQQLPAPPGNLFGGGAGLPGGLPQPQAAPGPQEPIQLDALQGLISPQQPGAGVGNPGAPGFVGPQSPFIPGNPGFVGPLQPGTPGTPGFVGPLPR